MKTKMRLATLILLGAVPLVGIGADYGNPSTQSTPAAPSSATETPSGSMGMPGSSRGMENTPATGAAATDSTMQSTAQAADVPRQFKRLDKDKDGMISRSEAKRSKDTMAQFDSIDTDHDGKISLSEWQTVHPSSGMGGVSGSSRNRVDTPAAQ